MSRVAPGAIPRSPEEIWKTGHEENVLLFFEGSESDEKWFGDSFESILDDVEKQLKSNNLSISIRVDGLDRQTKYSNFLWNSVWVFHQECFLEELINESSLKPYLSGCPIPTNTRVVYCTSEEKSSKIGCGIRDICGNPVPAINRGSLFSVLVAYFTDNNPDDYPEGCKNVHDWYKDVQSTMSFH
jgi:hypothetical protein